MKQESSPVGYYNRDSKGETKQWVDYYNRDCKEATQQSGRLLQ